MQNITKLTQTTDELKSYQQQIVEGTYYLARPVDRVILYVSMYAITRISS